MKGNGREENADGEGIFSDENDIYELVKAANETTLAEFNRLFSNERMKKVSHYNVFSMKEARRAMKDFLAVRFAGESTNDILNLFCNEFYYTAKWRDSPDKYNN